MKFTPAHIANIGVVDGLELLEQRRIRLLNIIDVIAGLLCCFFIILDTVLQAYYQAIINFVVVIVGILPVLYLNYRGKYLIARIYFIVIALIFLNTVSFVTIQQLRDTDTENILVGFSVLIIVLYDNPIKSIAFFVTALSLVVLKTIKHDLFGWSYDSDFAFLIINLFVSFLCVYLFTGAFKNDLLMTLDKLENQQNEIVKQRNDLEANRHLLRSMINNVPLFMAMVDKEGKYLIVNAKYEGAFGLPVEQIEGKDYKDILPENILATHVPLIERCLEGEVTEFNESVELPNGDMFHSYGKYQPIRNEQGDVISLVVYVSDITKLKEAENELQHMNATKSKLLSILSHDLKSPLNSLAGLLSIAQNVSHDEFIRLVAKIEHQVETVSFTMDNMLHWVRSQLKGEKINITDINLGDIVDNCINLYNNELESKQIQINNNLNGDSLVRADPNHMKLVVRNILNNAIKFTENGGAITFDAEANDDGVVLTIEDNGIGIPDDKLKNLSSSKINKSISGTEGETGTGLGLALCMDVLALNGGKLELHSVQGQGTTARIHLPV